MLSFVVFVVGVLVVGGLLFLGASVLLGRGETQPPAELDRSPVELPDDRPVTADDVRALRISVAFRGYRMTEIDWLLDQFALVLEERDAEIATLTVRLSPPPEDAPETKDDEAAITTLTARLSPPPEDAPEKPEKKDDEAAAEEADSPDEEESPRA